MCASDSVDGHPLPIDELKGIKAVESINLSGKGLEVASAIIISACIAGNAHLRELKCACHLNLSVPQGDGTQDVDMQLCLWVDLSFHACRSLDGNHIREKGAAELAKVLSQCEALVSLR